MAHKNKTNVSPYKTRQQSRGTPAPNRFSVHKKPQQIYSVEEANDRLYDLFKNHGLTWVSHAERLQLAKFYVLLMENQKIHNFTRIMTLKDVGIKHFVDCLMISRLTEFKFPLLDVGTGPGFPGIPLKIIYPKSRILLAEGVQKRVEFLKLIRSELHLQELDIIGRNINKFFALPVQGVITRAVEDVRNTLGNVLSCLQVGGKVFLMKGPNVDPEIKLGLEEYGEYYRLDKDIAYDLPLTQNHRRLVVFEKIKEGPPVDEFVHEDSQYEKDESEESFEDDSE